jgi:hypothetical protein
MILLIAALWVGVSLDQDRKIGRTLYSAKVDPELVAFLQNLPQDGRLLVDLSPGNGWERYHRYVIYTFLRDRPFISTHDGQPYPLYVSRMIPDKASFLREPVAYILTEGEARFRDLTVVARQGNFRLLLAKGQRIVFTLEPISEPPLKLASTPEGLELLDEAGLEWKDRP